MIRKLALLLAPDLDAGGGGGADLMEAPPESLKGWGGWEQERDRINKAEADATGANKGGNKDGKETAGAGGNGAAGGAAPKPDAGGTGGDPNAGGTAEAAKAAADKAAADKAAADAAAANKGAAEEQIPQSKKDWEKWKAGRKESEDKLKTEIAENKKQLEAAQAKVKEYEASKPGEDPKTKAEIERLTTENKELTDRLTVLDVTKHPKFEQHYNGRVNEQMERAKSILGEEKFKEFEAALKMPEGDESDAKFEAILEDLSSIKKSKLGNVLQSLDKIEQDRQADIKGAEAKKKEIEGRNKEQSEKIVATREKMFNDELSKLQDAKDGMLIFQEKAGEENKEWNDGVRARVQLAKQIMTGKDMKPEDIIRRVFHAAAFPALLKSYSTAMQEKNAEIAKLTEQVKKLQGAQVTIVDGQDTGEADTTERRGKKGTVDTKDKEVRPHEVSRSWVEKMRSGLAGE